MGPEGQRPEGKASNQPSAWSTSIALQEANLNTSTLGSRHGKYLGNEGPQEEARVPKPPLMGAPIFTVEECTLFRHSWPTNSWLRKLRYPQIVEVRPTQDPPIEIYLYDKTDSLLPRPFWMDEDNRATTTHPQSGHSSVPRSSMGDFGSATKANHLSKPSFTINPSNHSIISCPHTVRVEAPRQPSQMAGLKEGNVRRAASMTSNTIIVNFKPHVPGDPDAQPKAAKSKSETDIRRIRPTCAHRRRHVSLQRGSQIPAISALELYPSMEGTTHGIWSAIDRSDGDRTKSHWVASCTKRVQLTSSATLLEGQAIEDMAAEEWTDKPFNNKVSSKVTTSKPLGSTSIKAEIPETLPPIRAADFNILSSPKADVPKTLYPPKAQFSKTLTPNKEDIPKTLSHLKAEVLRTLYSKRAETAKAQHPTRLDMSKIWPFKLRTSLLDMYKKSDVAKTVRFDLASKKAAESPAARAKLTVDKVNPSQATSNTKNRPKIKSCPFMNNYEEFKAKYHTSELEEKKQRKDTSLRNSKQETKSPQAAVTATAVESQAPRTNSTTQDTKGNKATSSTPKIVGQRTPLLGARDETSQDATRKRQAATIPLVSCSPATRLLPMRRNMTTKDAEPVADGIITIIVFAKDNREVFRRQRALLGASTSRYHPPAEKQALPKLPQREGQPKMCHTTLQALAGTLGPQHTRPGDVTGGMTLHHCTRSLPHIPNSSEQRKSVSIPKKMPELNYNFIRKTMGQPSIMDFLEREFHIGQLDLKQKRKQLHEQHLYGKDCHTSFLEYLLSDTVEPEPAQQGFNGTTEEPRHNSTLQPMQSTTDYKEYLEILERLKIRNQFHTTSDDALEDDTQYINQQVLCPKKTHEERLAETWNKLSTSLRKRQPLQRKLCDRGIQQLRAYQMRRRLTRKPGIVREVWYRGGFSLPKKEKSPKILKPLKPTSPARNFKVNKTFTD